VVRRVFSAFGRKRSDASSSSSSSSSSVQPVSSYREHTDCRQSFAPCPDFYRQLSLSLYSYLVSSHLFRHRAHYWKWIKLYFGTAVLALQPHAAFLGTYRHSASEVSRYREQVAAAKRDRETTTTTTTGHSTPVQRHATESVLVELFKYLQLLLCNRTDLLLATKRQIRMLPRGDQIDESPLDEDESLVDPWMFADLLKRRQQKTVAPPQSKFVDSATTLSDAAEQSSATLNYDSLNVFDVFTELFTDS
jgi:hypothetical protein